MERFAHGSCIGRQPNDDGITVCSSLWHRDQDRCHARVLSHSRRDAHFTIVAIVTCEVKVDGRGSGGVCAAEVFVESEGVFHLV